MMTWTAYLMLVRILTYVGNSSIHTRTHTKNKKKKEKTFGAPDIIRAQSTVCEWCTFSDQNEVQVAPCNLSNLAHGGHRVNNQDDDGDRPRLREHE